MHINNLPPLPWKIEKEITGRKPLTHVVRLLDNDGNVITSWFADDEEQGRKNQQMATFFMDCLSSSTPLDRLISGLIALRTAARNPQISDVMLTHNDYAHTEINAATSELLRALGWETDFCGNWIHKEFQLTGETAQPKPPENEPATMAVEKVNKAVLLNLSIDVLRLPKKMTEKLKAIGVDKVRDLTKTTEGTLLRIPNIGVKKIDELRKVLIKYGLDIKTMQARTKYERRPTPTTQR